MDITFWLEILLFVALLGFSAFFSSSETSLFSLTERQLAQMRRDDNPRVGLIERMLSEPRRLIITILIGNELVNVSASVLSAALVIVLWGAENKFVNLFIMVPILLLVGEITPKTLAIRNNVAFATFQSRPIDTFARLIAPLRWVVRRIADFFITLMVGRERSRGNLVTEDMLRTLADEAVGEGELDILEARTIGQIFEFGDKTLEEVMTPRASIHYLPVEMSPVEMVGEIRQSRYSKSPVFEETRDNIVGILYARDLLGQDLGDLSRDPAALRGILRQPYFVPETKPVAELFQAFRRRRQSLALTVDEFGGAEGIVTIEDVMEEVVAELQDEFDEGEADPQWIRKLGERHYMASGRVEVDTLQQELGLEIPRGKYATIAGFLLERAKDVPEQGEVIAWQGITFTIHRALPQVIQEVRIQW